MTPTRKQRITVRLTPNQFQCITEMSSALHTSYSLLIRSIIQDFIIKNEDRLERIIEKHQYDDADPELE